MNFSTCAMCFVFTSVLKPLIQYHFSLVSEDWLTKVVFCFCSCDSQRALSLQTIFNVFMQVITKKNLLDMNENQYQYKLQVKALISQHNFIAPSIEHSGIKSFDIDENIDNHFQYRYISFTFTAYSTTCIKENDFFVKDRNSYMHFSSL